MTCGWPVDDLWMIYGWPVADLWMTCGWPMGDLWVTCGWPVDNLWVTCGWPVDNLWVTCGWPVMWPVCGPFRRLVLMTWKRERNRWRVWRRLFDRRRWPSFSGFSTSADSMPYWAFSRTWTRPPDRSLSTLPPSPAFKTSWTVRYEYLIVYGAYRSHNKLCYGMSYSIWKGRWKER